MNQNIINKKGKYFFIKIKEVTMKLNMGTIDRVIRILLGLGLLTGAVAVYLIPKIPVLSIILGILGLVMLGTSAIGFCPLYAPFKITTRKK